MLRSFLVTTQKAQSTKELTDKLHFTNIKSSAIHKDIVIVKKKPETGRKSFQSIYPVKNLALKI